MTRTARAAALGLVLSLGLLGACGGSDDESTSTDTSAEASDGEDTDAASEAPDMCELVTAEEVGAILGGTVTSEESPIGGCDFTQEDPRASSANVGSILESEMGGGFEVYAQGAEAALQDATVTDPGVGEESFVVAGTVAGLGSKQVAGAVLAGDGVIVTVNFSQPSAMDDAAAVQQVTDLLTLANSKL